MLIGKYNKFGNIEEGRAAVDTITGHTIYKTNLGQAIVIGNLQPSEKATVINIDSQRDMIVLSEKVSQLIKATILATPGYRGLNL